MAEKKPGVMIYHDDFISYTEVLSLEQMGKLFVAILKFSAFDEIPDFEDDRELKIIWIGVMKGIERDAKRYVENCKNKKYAAYCRECDKNGVPRMTKEQWKKTNGYFDIE